MVIIIMTDHSFLQNLVRLLLSLHPYTITFPGVSVCPFSDTTSDSEKLESLTCNGQGSNPGLSDRRVSAISTPPALHLRDLPSLCPLLQITCSIDTH